MQAEVLPKDDRKDVALTTMGLLHSLAHASTFTDADF